MESKKFKLNNVVFTTVYLDSLVKNNKLITLDIDDGTISGNIKIENGVIKNEILKEDNNA